MLYIAGLELSESNEVEVKNRFIWLEFFGYIQFYHNNHKKEKSNKQTKKKKKIQKQAYTWVDFDLDDS